MIPFIFLTLYENLWIVFHPHMNSKLLDSFFLFYNHVLSYHGFVFKYLLLFLFFLLCTSVAVNQVDNPLETERTKRIGLHPSDPNYFYRKFLLNKRSDMVYIYIGQGSLLQSCLVYWMKSSLVEMSVLSSDCS